LQRLRLSRKFFGGGGLNNKKAVLSQR